MLVVPCNCLAMARQGRVGQPTRVATAVHTHAYGPAAHCTRQALGAGGRGGERGMAVSPWNVCAHPPSIQKGGARQLHSSDHTIQTACRRAGNRYARPAVVALHRRTLAHAREREAASSPRAAGTGTGLHLAATTARLHGHMPPCLLLLDLSTNATHAAAAGGNCLHTVHLSPL